MCHLAFVKTVTEGDSKFKKKKKELTVASFVSRSLCVTDNNFSTATLGTFGIWLKEKQY